MKKNIILLLIITIIASLSIAYGESPVTNADSHILMDYETMIILDSKEMHKLQFPASTTKIMTGILAIEHGNLDDIVTIDQEIVDLTYGSHIALEPGEQLPLRDVLYALLLRSANDSALAIAKHISGSIEDFVDLMNEKAKEIGALNTNFVNPNGLHDENHVTTAYDLALIAKYAMENDTFREYVNTSAYTIEATEIKGEPRYLYTTNKLLTSSVNIDLDGQTVPITYKGAQGVKTGYTEEASNCLVSYAQRDGQELLTVVLKSQSTQVYVDTHKLLNHGFSNFQNSIVGSKNEFIGNIDILNGKVPLVGGILENDIIQPINKLQIEEIDRKINLRANLEAPIKEGEIIGVMEYYRDGEIVGQNNILSTMDIEAIPPRTMFSILIGYWYIVVILFIIVARTMVLVNKRKRRRRRRSKSLFV